MTFGKEKVLQMSQQQQEIDMTRHELPSKRQKIDWFLKKFKFNSFSLEV